MYRWEFFPAQIIILNHIFYIHTSILQFYGPLARANAHFVGI